MTEKQGNTKQSNLNYIHTVINIKKKHVKTKARTSKKFRIGVIFKVFKGKEIANQKPRDKRTDPCHPSRSLVYC